MNNYETVKLNTARNALRYVIKAFDIKEIYVPYYICPAIRSAVLKENCKVNFYHIGLDFKPIQEFPKDAYILYPNYFGVCGLIAERLSKEYKNLIVDNAHSFFSEPKGIASFNSARKFFPDLQDGAFLYTQKTADTDIEKDNHIYDYKELSYEELCKNENRLDKEDIKLMSDCTGKYISNIDTEKEKQKYKERFNKCKFMFENLNLLEYKIQDGDIPFKYPFLASDEQSADILAKKLEQDGITVFRYWNNMPDDYPEKAFYTRLIAI